jgi:hypothetical protein
MEKGYIRLAENQILGMGPVICQGKNFNVKMHWSALAFLPAAEIPVF